MHKGPVRRKPDSAGYSLGATPYFLLDFNYVTFPSPTFLACVRPVLASALRRLRLLVHHLAQLLRRLAEILGLAFERFLRRVLLLQELVGALQRGFDLALLVGADLVAVFAERLLHAVHERVELVAR